MMNTNPKHWSRAWFNIGSNCDSVDNNMCEGSIMEKGKEVLQEGRPQKKTKIIGDDATGVPSQSRTHGDVTTQSSMMTTPVKRKKVYPAMTRNSPRLKAAGKPVN